MESSVRRKRGQRGTTVGLGGHFNRGSCLDKQGIMLRKRDSLEKRDNVLDFCLR